MYKVYSEFVRTGKIRYLQSFPTKEEAICHIKKCYCIDEKILQLGEYYYFFK